MSEELKLDLLKRLDACGAVEDAAAAYPGVAVEAILGALKSLESQEKVAYETLATEVWSVEAEGEDQLAHGSYEAQIFAAVPPGDEGISIDELKARFGAAKASLGQGRGFKNKWIKKTGANVVRLVDAIVDETRADLETIKATGTHPAKDVLKALKGRGLIKAAKVLSYAVRKGPRFSTELKKQATDLTAAMLHSGAWKTAEFKKFNFDALGISPAGGHLHPLMKVREEFRQVFFEVGFVEMPTNSFVESAFWNFDALFVPQKHPSRKLQDTFYVRDPPAATSLPAFWQDVKRVHESGGYGSIGHRCEWDVDEAQCLVLRTHTTPVSARMLYQLAQGPYRPAKYFSIDRVYRNEAVDNTHLAEFHQVEGAIADKNMSLGSLIDFLGVFFEKMGITNLRFKPTFNPYTEPSMEIFSWHEESGKWLEIGNSGMFRPEMLRPMGLPEDVKVAGFGLSLERPTMIKYGIDNIRKLFGHSVAVSMIEASPACRLDKKMGQEVFQAADEC
ncbi:Phenylalanyl-tRNA synthetase, beta subunit, cytoplasmic [Coemansia javaensis]|uniref:Probable phenylalanine--tRNA ligase alpha subunit n=1 Tax=Coemansia javaensis TaxID=2761396 RepID=A0A9W8HF73_9FUNG|nr:Phenylalanyl-tRNA synthetase, beta subunit, cytoplasmic [Coemansia javaensis]